jgi:CBS domain-containing protein
METTSSLRNETAARKEGQGDGAEATPLLTTSDLPSRSFPPRVLSDLMTRKVITVSENDAIGDLETWMKRFRFHHLPVVTAEMKLAGLITRSDLLHASLGAGPDGKPMEKAGPDTFAGAIMRRGVVTGTPDTSLTMACRVMLQEKLGCLPIVLENGTLVGIVTRTDLVRLAVHLLERQV